MTGRGCRDCSARLPRGHSRRERPQKDGLSCFLHRPRPTPTEGTLPPSAGAPRVRGALREEADRQPLTIWMCLCIWR